MTWEHRVTLNVKISIACLFIYPSFQEEFCNAQLTDYSVWFFESNGGAPKWMLFDDKIQEILNTSVIRFVEVKLGEHFWRVDTHKMSMINFDRQERAVRNERVQNDYLR